MAQRFSIFWITPLNCGWQNTYLVKFLAPVEQICIRSHLIKLCKAYWFSRGKSRMYQDMLAYTYKKHPQISITLCFLCLNLLFGKLNIFCLCIKNHNLISLKSIEINIPAYIVKWASFWEILNFVTGTQWEVGSCCLTPFLKKN